MLGGLAPYRARRSLIARLAAGPNNDGKPARHERISVYSDVNIIF